MTLLIIYVVLALGASFLCSILEASLLTITPAEIQTGKLKGQRWANQYEEYKREIDRPLAAILTLNTVAHTMGAAGAGAQYASVFGNGTEALFAAGLTLAVLILTEIIPKTIGARYAVGVAPFVSRVMPVLMYLLAPLVWFSQQLTKVITFGKAQELPKYRDDLMAVARLGQESGQLQEGETRILNNLLQMHTVRAHDIMTPRLVTFSLPQSMSLGDFVSAIKGKPFSRIPVFESDAADISGFVLKSELLATYIESDDAPKTCLADFARPLVSTPETTPLDRLFKRFIQEHAHIMSVVDEYGRTLGIVTLEDILETIFGIEIVDESDSIADLQAYARSLWQQRAKRMGLPLDDEDVLLLEAIGKRNPDAV
ncbi:DUF21 domain-containing protein [Lampropedia puyangensis]|uniref:DUF21 domain-containing protein n=1 Tax=Lampropedia puyangensis TaxID=1330072 RepID=A0A4S8F9K7_9BURK|nr:CNNM domain-containing protein [Lampropedia puyangensis]THU03691.1 DUF21 domain-containing protein [Lampropedia puyangensis]